MRFLVSKFMLLVLVTYFVTACNPDDSLSSEQPAKEIVTYDCCGEQGQLPSEPDDEDEDD